MFAQPRALTILYTYYGQKDRIAGIIAEKHPDTRVIIIDDGSPEPLEKIDGIDVYRVLVDIPWNMPGAKNLGFHVSDGWIVCSDIDHLITKENAEEIIQLKKERGTMYYLGRCDVVTKDIDDIWNTFCIHKDDFVLVGGYDEDFSGNYGFDDLLFLRHCRNNLNVQEVRNIKVKLFHNAGVKTLNRDSKHNAGLIELKKNTFRNNNDRMRFKWAAV
jgi:hypothetical protein